jgi:hypothetical protein
MNPRHAAAPTAIEQTSYRDYRDAMRTIKIEAANGRSISEEVQAATNLLDDATIPYSVNIQVADADEDAATFVFHGARIRFSAGYPVRDPYEKPHA